MAPLGPGSGASVLTQPYRFPDVADVVRHTAKLQEFLREHPVSPLLGTLSLGRRDAPVRPFLPLVLSLFLTHFKANCKHLYL